MGYMVLAVTEERSHLGSGLSLAEAFVRIMALAHCDYIFHRVAGVMHLTLHHLDCVPDDYRTDPDYRARYFPDHRSALVDDRMARAEIMRKILGTGIKGYIAIRDNYTRSRPDEVLSEPDLARVEHAIP